MKWIINKEERFFQIIRKYRSRNDCCIVVVRFSISSRDI